MTFLAEYYDPEVQIPEDMTKESITTSESERLAQLSIIARAAKEIPRRLGVDAGSDELAVDSKRCRRVAHVAEQLAKAWGGRPKMERIDASRAAATVRWDDWWEEHQVWLRNRRRVIATWGVSGSGDEKFAKSALVKLNNEERWLEYALR